VKCGGLGFLPIVRHPNLESGTFAEHIGDRSTLLQGKLSKPSMALMQRMLMTS
jgi:hypothetical protein